MGITVDTTLLTRWSPTGNTRALQDAQGGMLDGATSTRNCAPDRCIGCAKSNSRRGIRAFLAVHAILCTRHSTVQTAQRLIWWGNSDRCTDLCTGLHGELSQEGPDAADCARSHGLNPPRCLEGCTSVCAKACGGVQPDCAAGNGLEQRPPGGFGEELEGGAAGESGVEVHGGEAGSEFELGGESVEVRADAAVGDCPGY